MSNQHEFDMCSACVGHKEIKIWQDRTNGKDSTNDLSNVTVMPSDAGKYSISTCSWTLQLVTQ
jgi:hypothetical protein